MSFGSKAALETAVQIAEWLCHTAYQCQGLCNWMGTTQQADEDSEALEIAYETLGPDLYGGTSGVSLFLAETYAHTNDPRYRDIAEGAVRHALSQAHGIPREDRFGFYHGRVGVAYAATRIAGLLDRPGLLDLLSDTLTPLFGGLDETVSLDVISGAAGAAPALLHLADRLKRPDLAALARALGDRMISTANRSSEGWSWGGLATESEPARGLTGFAHGAAGFGWSLLELWRYSSEARFLEAARHAFAYENHWFQHGQDNWSDLRDWDPSDGPAPCGLAWCHGAPGIGLSRLRALELQDDAQCRRDAEAAARAAKRALTDADRQHELGFSLCHGLAGIADFLLLAAVALPDPDARRVAWETAAAGAARYAGRPANWPCGLARGSTPSLMTGLAGIGYFYLRLADPTVPSVLLVTPTRSGPLPDHRKGSRARR